MKKLLLSFFLCTFIITTTALASDNHPTPGTSQKIALEKEITKLQKEIVSSYEKHAAMLRGKPEHASETRARIAYLTEKETALRSKNQELTELQNQQDRYKALEKEIQQLDAKIQSLYYPVASKKDSSNQEIQNMFDQIEPLTEKKAELEYKQEKIAARLQMKEEAERTAKFQQLEARLLQWRDNQ